MHPRMKLDLPVPLAPHTSRLMGVVMGRWLRSEMKRLLPAAPLDAAVAAAGRAFAIWALLARDDPAGSREGVKRLSSTALARWEAGAGRTGRVDGARRAGTASAGEKLKVAHCGCWIAMRGCAATAGRLGASTVWLARFAGPRAFISQLHRSVHTNAGKFCKPCRLLLLAS